MIKYAKVMDKETKQCNVGIGTDCEFYISIGMTEMDVEQAYDGSWYVTGYAPEKPEPTYEEVSQAREAEYVRLIDPLHARKLRRTVLGKWTEEDEAEYVAKVTELSDKIAAEHPYPEEPETQE